MNSWRMVFTLVLAMSVSVHAQWAELSDRRSSRLPDGASKPLGACSTNRRCKPDLSAFGPWRRDARQMVAIDYPPRPSSWIRAKLEGGLPYQPWAADLVKERSAQFGRDDPVGFCRPPALMRIAHFPPPRKIIQTPSLVVISIGARRDVSAAVRGWTPSPTDPEPVVERIFNGKWEGDTFVVETNGLKEGFGSIAKGVHD